MLHWDVHWTLTWRCWAVADWSVQSPCKRFTLKMWAKKLSVHRLYLNLRPSSSETSRNPFLFFCFNWQDYPLATLPQAWQPWLLVKGTETSPSRCPHLGFLSLNVSLSNSQYMDHYGPADDSPGSSADCRLRRCEQEWLRKSQSKLLCSCKTLPSLPAGLYEHNLSNNSPRYCNLPHPEDTPQTEYVQEQGLFHWALGGKDYLKSLGFWKE